MWRDRSRREILVVNRIRYDDWTLPKGKLDDGETFSGAALREVEEETGCRATLEGWAGETMYPVAGRPKSVLFFHMLAEPGSEPRPEDTSEVIAASWLPVATALKKLTHDDERDLVARSAGS